MRRWGVGPLGSDAREAGSWQHYGRASDTIGAATDEARKRFLASLLPRQDQLALGEKRRRVFGENFELLDFGKLCFSEVAPRFPQNPNISAIGCLEGRAEGRAKL